MVLVSLGTSVQTCVTVVFISLGTLQHQLLPPTAQCMLPVCSQSWGTWFAVTDISNKQDEGHERSSFASEALAEVGQTDAGLPLYHASGSQAAPGGWGRSHSQGTQQGHRHLSPSCRLLEMNIRASDMIEA